MAAEAAGRRPAGQRDAGRSSPLGRQRRGLQHLKGLPQLQRLDLVGTTVSDAGLEHIEGLAQLQSLYLGDTKVSDAGLQHLKGLTQLKLLGLNETRVSDAGLEHLKGLTQLQSLYLGHTKVSDPGLRHLKGLRQLQLSGPPGHQGERRRTGTPQGIDPTPKALALPHQGHGRGREETPTGIAEMLD